MRIVVPASLLIRASDVSLRKIPERLATVHKLILANFIEYLRGFSHRKSPLCTCNALPSCTVKKCVLLRDQDCSDNMHVFCSYENRLIWSVHYAHFVSGVSLSRVAILNKKLFFQSRDCVDVCTVWHDFQRLSDSMPTRKFWRFLACLFNFAVPLVVFSAGIGKLRRVSDDTIRINEGERREWLWWMSFFHCAMVIGFATKRSGWKKKVSIMKWEKLRFR